MTRYRRLVQSFAVGLLAAACCGCSRSDSTQSPVGDVDPATLRYGYAPIASRAITYQPDVVIVQGGARSIRSASANGLVWTIDGSAPGADQVRVGKVMFVTG